MSNNLSNESDWPIVIIETGHSIYELSRCAVPVSGEILAAGKALNCLNPTTQQFSEFMYCKAFGALVCAALKANNIKGITANRADGFDINGHIKAGQKRSYGPVVRAANKYIDQHKGQVKAFISLHTNGGGGKYYLSYSNTPGVKLAGFLSNAVRNTINEGLSTLGISGDKMIFTSAFGADAKTSNLNVNKAAKKPVGSSYATGIRPEVPALLVELFFADYKPHMHVAILKAKELAENFAKAIVSFINGENAPFNALEAEEASRVVSSSLVTEQIKENIEPDQKKEVAINTQTKLTPIESRMGEGGDRYHFSLRNDIEIVGTKPPPFDPSLVDVTGNVFSKPILRHGGTVKEQRTYPAYQAIDYTSDIPTGRKSIYVNSLYDLNAYETNINSASHFRVKAGGIGKISAEQQLDVSAGSNLVLNAGAVLKVSSNDIILAGETIIDASTSVSGNILASGIGYFDGGVNATSFNGPAEIDETNKQELYGYLPSDKVTAMIRKGEIKNGVITGVTAVWKDAEGRPVVLENAQISFTSMVVGEGTTLEIESVDSGKGKENAAITTVPAHSHFFRRLRGNLANNALEIQDNIAPTINS